MTSLADAPSVQAVTRALYGGSVSAEDLVKSIDAADVHMDGTFGRARRRRRPAKATCMPISKDLLGGTADKGRKKSLLAGGLLAGAGIEALAAKDTLAPLTQGIKELKPLVAGAQGAGAKIKELKPLVAGAPGKVLPATAGPGTKTALQAGNFAVGVGAAKELIDPKKKLVPGTQVNKGLKVSLKPLNAAAVRRGAPTLKAVRPAGSPAVQKSLFAAGEISKIDEDKRQVFGWASISVLDGELVRDRQGDEILIGELEKAAYDYVLDSRIGGDQHARIEKFVGSPKHTSDVIESMVFTPEKIAKLGLPADFPQGWWLGMQVNDESTWQLIKSGRRTGFSVHGTGRRTPIEKLDTGQRRKKAAAVPLRERARQAIHPPAVRRHAVDSTALRSVGYQPQTRKLDVEMNSRPDAPYSYRVSAATAAKVINAPSKGRAYTSEIRNKAPHHTSYTVADRVRLFASPQQ